MIESIRKVVGLYNTSEIKEITVQNITPHAHYGTIISIIGVEVNSQQLAHLLAAEFKTNVMVNEYKGIYEPKNSVILMSFWDMVKFYLIKKLQ